MKQIIKKILCTKLIHAFFKNCFALYTTKFYSQEGENLNVKRIFGKQKKGFCIHIGAHHPFRFSNIYLFYKGWKGINIDAIPDSMKLFNHFRSKDISLQTPIGRDREILEYFSFNKPTLNTFDKDLTTHYLKTHSMQTFSLAKILKKYLLIGQKIDFMSIDAEDLDFQVFQSNNWKKISPQNFACKGSRGGGIWKKFSPLLSMLIYQLKTTSFLPKHSILSFSKTRSL